MMMRDFVPAASQAVQACKIPDPSDHVYYGRFVGDLIVAGYVRSVEILEPRDATTKSPAFKGAIHFKPVKGKGFSRQPGDWLIYTDDEGLRGLSAERWESLGLVPAEHGTTEPVDDPDVAELDQDDEPIVWEDSDDPTKRPKRGAKAAD